MASGLNFWILFIFGCCLCFNIVLCNKCFKDDSLGDREGNVYYCNDANKPECCEEDNAFTCCEEQTKKSLREQLILWGSVSGVVLLIVLVCCYFWRDGDCCKGDKTMREKCCSCCRKSSVDDKAKLSDIAEPGTSSGTMNAKRPWFSKDPSYDDDNLSISPAPQFTFKSPTYGKY
ncbi:hypothetical protein ACF0H5_016072 [Mactra antiquata]